MNSPAQSRITRWITCIQPADSGELEKAEDDRKAEAAEDTHKTADHASGLEATLDQDMWARNNGHTYDAGAYQLGESLPAKLRSGSYRFLITS